MGCSILPGDDGHLTASRVSYHLFDPRVERAVLPYTRAHGIGFMAYGSRGLGFLTGAFKESTTSVDGPLSASSRDVSPGRSDRCTTDDNSSQSLSLVVDEDARTAPLTAAQPL